MQVIVYQIRGNGVEIARQLLTNEGRSIAELSLDLFEDGKRRGPIKDLRKRDNGCGTLET